jgi:hypothetical protein
MKKFTLLLLVLTGMVSTASAQWQTANTIRVAFSNPNGAFTESHYYIYVFDSNNNDNWPGVDVTENTEVINGITYYYRDLPTATYGTSLSFIAVNDDGAGNNRKQSVDINWSWNGTSTDKIKKDTYCNILSTKTAQFNSSVGDHHVTTIRI